MAFNNHQKAPYTLVKLAADEEDPALVSGKYFPQRVMMQPCYTSALIVDSQDRVAGFGDGFNFVIDLHQEITRARSIQLTRIILPKVPNINTNNNTISFKHELSGSTILTFTLPNGFYSPANLATAIAQNMSALLVAYGGSTTGQIIGSYNVGNYDHLITIHDIQDKKFFFDMNSSFIKYAVNVAGLPGLDISGDPAVVGSGTISSSHVLYSRYYIIQSKRLSETMRTPSFSSDLRNGIIGIVDCVDNFLPEDYSESTNNTTADFSADVLNAPLINIALDQKNISTFDITITDEFGFSPTTSLSNNGQVVPTFNTVLWFSMYL
jgi:hypothetical protein